MNIWIFGHSACLPHGIDNVNECWTKQLQLSINANQLFVLAKEGVDNLFIYHSILSNINQIQHDDIVIVGWSHPSRKCFISDDIYHDYNLNEKTATIYPGTPTFFRSRGVAHDTKNKWLSMKPKNQGVPYFDTWFQCYYNPIETQLNFRAYVDSARSMIPCQHLDFWFSKESVKDLDVSGFYWLDFILEHKVWLSDTDTHPNCQGHNMISEYFKNQLTQV